MAKYRSDVTVSAQPDCVPSFSPRPLVAAVSRALPGAMLLSAGVLISQPALAATYPVSNTNDSGSGSLRDAIDQANLNPGADIITFNSSVTGTISLTTGTLQITDDLDIQGPGASVLTVNGSGIVTANAQGHQHEHHGKGERTGSTSSHASRGLALYGSVFTVGTYSGPPAATDGTQRALATSTVTISGLTISGGNSPDGGGINADNTHLTISQCAVTGNYAYNHGGGISISSKYSSLLVADSNVSGNSAYYGGGISTTSSAITIQRTTVSNNTARTTYDYGGGGVFVHNDNYNAVTIADSTISGNRSYNNAGGVFVRHVEAHISNSTLANNSATLGGAGLYLYGEYSNTTLSNSTVTGNSAGTAGGGVSQSGEAYDGFNISNTVVAGNTDSVGNPDVNTNDYQIYVDHSLIQDAGSATIVDNGGNIFAQAPMLGALADNGGPTLTQLPLAGSPLIDAGDPAFTGPPDFDQRGSGFPRVVNGTLDIGATEFSAAAPPPVQFAAVPTLGDAGRLGLGALLGLAGLAVARRRKQARPVQPD